MTRTVTALARRSAPFVLIAASLAPAPLVAARDPHLRMEAVPAAHAETPIPTLVVTPPSYATSTERRYPVLYFLHDAQGDESILVKKGIVAELLAMMERKELPELVIVAPRGVDSWWVDSYDGRSRMATFLSEELVPYVDLHYRTIASRAGRSVAGISMGGYGALRWAVTRGDLFSSAGALSPAIQQLEFRTVAVLPFFVRPSFSRVFGTDAVHNSYQRYDLYQTLMSRPELARTVPPILVRSGTADMYRLTEIGSFFRRFLNAMEIPNEVVADEGAHDWTYWKRVFPDFVKRLTRSFAS